MPALYAGVQRLQPSMSISPQMERTWGAGGVVEHADARVLC